MTDFDDLDATGASAEAVRDAVAAAAAAVTAPPFGRVERRARARRNRQVALVAAGAVGLLAAGALAVPRGGPRAVQPATPGPSASPACGGLVYVTPGGDGREPVPASCLDGEDAGDARCWVEDAPRPGEPGGRTLGSGSAGPTRWWVVGWTGKEGARCVGWFSDPAGGVTWQMDLDNDTGPDGALRPVISRDGLAVRGAEDWEWMVYWGAVPPEVVRVDLVDGTRVVGTLVPVDGGDRKYVAGAVRAPDERHGEPVAYDAEGNVVPIPD